MQRWFIHRFYDRVASVLSQYGYVSSGSVLDIGCGEGFAARALNRRGIKGNILGVDVDEHALRIKGLRSLLRPVCADARYLPYRTVAVDCVICLETLEHLDDPESGLCELNRVARDLLVLSVPDQPLYSIANLLRGKNWRTGGDDPDHRQAWRPNGFVAFVSQQAQVVDVQRSFPWVVVVARPRRP